MNVIINFRFGNKIGLFRGTVPFAQNEEQATAAQVVPADLQNAATDPYLVAQWKRLGITPSPPIVDGAFIRRATLHICGSLPTVAEVRVSSVANSRKSSRI